MQAIIVLLAPWKPRYRLQCLAISENRKLSHWGFQPSLGGPFFLFAAVRPIMPTENSLLVTANATGNICSIGSNIIHGVF